MKASNHCRRKVQPATRNMCIIRIRHGAPEETPVVVPIRPISRGQGTTTSSPRSSHPSRLRQQPQASNGSVRFDGSQSQAIIIAQPSPRSSRPKMTVQHGSSYSYGSGPVPTESHDRPLSRRSYSRQGMLSGRQSGSLKYGISPRQSNVSYRSTRDREKIVVVDETGRRRESGFH